MTVQIFSWQSCRVPPIVHIFALTAKRFAKDPLDLLMNDARKSPVRKLSLDHFSTSLCQSQPSFMIMNQLDAVLGHIFRISSHN